MAFVPPGAPTLPVTLSGIFPQPTLMTSDTVSAVVTAGPPKWGIFDQSNNLVLQADNVVSLDYKRTWKIADYPIEQGDFSSYDKVTLPYEVKITFSQGGSESDRSTFMNTLEAIGASFDLYNIVTPEITYLNANVEMFGYRRTATDGVGLISVDMLLKEIRQTAEVAFSNTASPANAGQVNTGTQQPQPPTVAQTSVVTPPPTPAQPTILAVPPALNSGPAPILGVM